MKTVLTSARGIVSACRATSETPPMTSLGRMMAGKQDPMDSIVLGCGGPCRIRTCGLRIMSPQL